MVRVSGLSIALFAVFLLAIPALAVAGPVDNAKVTLLYNFQGFPNDGNDPLGSLTPGPGGVLYGVTSSGGGANAGVVFELTPPAAGQTAWTETVIHSFSGPDGANPLGALVSDAKGNLYGAAVEGGPPGSFGVVFELSPPAAAGGAWTETVLYAFTGRNGADPYARLIIDARGNLYGAAARGGAGWTSGAFTGTGVVFRLTPPAAGTTAWTGKVLSDFAGDVRKVGHPLPVGSTPRGGLAMDAAGDLYGTTAAGGEGCGTGCGAVFRLTRGEGDVWTRTDLHVFNFKDGYAPYSSLAIDRSGNLYGTTTGGGQYGKGVVFTLKRSAEGRRPVEKLTWTYRILHNFTGAGGDGADPQGDLVLDAAGNLYVTTPSGGTGGYGGVFKFSPIIERGGFWTETFLKVPVGAIGAGINAGVILDKAGNLYGAASTGGTSGDGLIFELTP